MISKKTNRGKENPFKILMPIPRLFIFNHIKIRIFEYYYKHKLTYFTTIINSQTCTHRELDHFIHDKCLKNGSN